MTERSRLTGELVALVRPDEGIEIGMRDRRRPQSSAYCDSWDGPAVCDKESAMPKPLLVSIIDDDESVREALPDLLKELGYSVQAFSSAEEFLSSDYVGLTKCLVLDLSMPGMSGSDLQRELELRRRQIPIVFITAHGDEKIRRHLIQQGAAECLFKPFSDVALRKALDRALPAN